MIVADAAGAVTQNEGDGGFALDRLLLAFLAAEAGGLILGDVIGGLVADRARAPIRQGRPATVRGGAGTRAHRNAPPGKSDCSVQAHDSPLFRPLEVNLKRGQSGTSPLPHP